MSDQDTEVHACVNAINRTEDVDGLKRSPEHPFFGLHSYLSHSDEFTEKAKKYGFHYKITKESTVLFKAAENLGKPIYSMVNRLIKTLLAQVTADMWEKRLFAEVQGVKFDSVVTISDMAATAVGGEEGVDCTMSIEFAFCNTEENGRKIVEKTMEIERIKEDEPEQS